MSDVKLPSILVHAAEPATAAAWRKWLVESGFRVSVADGAEAASDPFDLVVTNLELLAAPPPGFLERLRTNPVGVVAIGGGGPSDVKLPADATPRELRLVCRLLGEVIALRRRLTRADALRHRLSELALTDPVTGLPNRRAWDEELRRRLGELPATRGGLCLAILDLDDLKEVNESHGFQVGDQVLKRVANQLKIEKRPNDFVARVGGDEFGLLAFAPDADESAAIVDHARRGMVRPLAVSGPAPLTASGGYVLVVPGATAEPEALFAAADSALRRAKAQGKRRIQRAE